jgi:acyl-CoA dehydrogenase
MESRLPTEIADLAEAATSYFARIGGVDLARAAETDPTERKAARAALDALGAADLDPRADSDQLLASCALCRAAASVMLPWPLASQLLAVDGSYLTLIDPARVRIDHGTLDVTWVGSDLTGRAWSLIPGERSTGRLGPFVVKARLGPVAADLSWSDIARYLTLQAWMVLGALETGLADVTAHVRTRRQFGQALSEFQYIRFTLADAAVAIRGLEELAKLTAWRLGRVSADEALADAMALRLHAVEMAFGVLRTCHQFYGALGFCDETDLSVIDRHLQPLLRYPLSAEQLALALVPAVRDGVLSAAIA